MILEPTDTFRLNGAPIQFPGLEVGVMVYVTTAVEPLTLLMLSTTLPAPESFIETPETVPDMFVTCQVNVLGTEFPPKPLI